MLFDLQGHRGARGLKPENTLPSFEAAFDIGVSSVETDVHLSRDGVPVLIHDHQISVKMYRRISSAVPDPADRPWVSQLTLSELLGYRADGNPDAVRFPGQDAAVTPLSQWFGDSRGLDPYGIPTVAELFAFAAAYAGESGRNAGKTPQQQARTAQIRFDLEIKRVPFRPERIGDTFSLEQAGLLERAILDDVRQAGVVGRTRIRSFDHRSIRALRSLQPDLTTAVVLGGTAPIHPARLVADADAQLYCPDFEFLDEEQVRALHAAGIRVIPWTVNDGGDWQRLLDWGVDGITTDFPDRLAAFLRARNTSWA